MRLHRSETFNWHLSFILPCCDTTTSFIERPKRKTNSYTKIFFLKILLAEKNECPKPETVYGHFFRSSCVTEPKGRIHLLSSRWLQKKEYEAHFFIWRTLIKVERTHFGKHTHFCMHTVSFTHALLNTPTCVLHAHPLLTDARTQATQILISIQTSFLA